MFLLGVAVGLMLAGVIIWGMIRLRWIKLEVTLPKS